MCPANIIQHNSVHLAIKNATVNIPVKISNLICTLSFKTPSGKCLPIKTFKLRGLDPKARYTVERVTGARSGAAWMEDGLRLTLKDFDSTVREIEKV